MNSLKLMKSKQPYSVIYRKFTSRPQQRLRKETAKLCWEYNLTNPLDTDRKDLILRKLFRSKFDLFITSPFHCDYGLNINLTGPVFFNYGVDIVDTSPVTFGKNVRIGPHTCIACTGHSIDYHQRRQGVVISKPINIGDDVWLGANCFIKGGVAIGNHSVIGAGSVVTHNIPADVVAFGSPCNVHRKINRHDRIDNLK